MIKKSFLQLQRRKPDESNRRIDRDQLRSFGIHVGDGFGGQFKMAATVLLPHDRQHRFVEHEQRFLSELDLRRGCAVADEIHERGHFGQQRVRYSGVHNVHRINCHFTGSPSRCLLLLSQRVDHTGRLFVHILPAATQSLLSSLRHRRSIIRYAA